MAACVHLLPFLPGGLTACLIGCLAVDCPQVLSCGQTRPMIVCLSGCLELIIKGVHFWCGSLEGDCLCTKASACGMGLV